MNELDNVMYDSVLTMCVSVVSLGEISFQIHTVFDTRFNRKGNSKHTFCTIRELNPGP